MLLEDIGEKHRNRMAEQDGIGDLHHGGFEVQRKQHPFALRSINLFGDEGAECLPAHDRGVNDFARDQRRLGLQHRDTAILRHQFNARIGRRSHGGGYFRAIEIPARHIGDMGFGVLRPGAHLMRVVARILLHGTRRATVRIAFAQHGVHGAAEHLAVTGADFALHIIAGVVRVIRHLIALALQFLDRSLELRERGRDIR